VLHFVHLDPKPPVTTQHPLPQEIVLSPGVGATTSQFREIWRHRELIYLLVWREIKVRYRQTVFGAAWAVVQPIAMMLVFTIFFGRLAKLPSDGVPGPLFYFSALTPWHYFTSTVNSSTNTLVANQNLVKKVYFPRLILPIASVTAGLVDLGITLALLIGLMLYFGYPITFALLVIPGLIVALYVTTLTIGVWGSALNAVYRDIRFGITLALQMVMFLSPVAYPTSLVPEEWRFVYGLNPLVGIIEGFRWAITGTGSPPQLGFALSMGLVLIFLMLGIRRFWRVESTFADVI
jgi:lipopolysaccharide transport system permease protein